MSEGCLIYERMSRLFMSQGCPWGRLQKTSQRRPKMTSQGRPKMTSQGRPHFIYVPDISFMSQGHPGDVPGTLKKLF